LQDRANAWKQEGEFGEAAADFEKALRLDPGFAPHHNGLAWLLATCPDAKYRDGKKAVDSATLPCELTDWKVAEVHDTLAAAWAEAGNFDAAVKWQEKALGLLAKNDEWNRKDFEPRMTLYRTKKPYHE
jgi:tetratricopeptide (TPR) repeat protein